jgi:hypothetical protein
MYGKQGYFSFDKGSRMQSDPKFGQNGVVLIIPMPGKKVPECRSSLRTSGKELLEWCSCTFSHKNSPDNKCYSKILSYDDSCMHFGINLQLYLCQVFSKCNRFKSIRYAYMAA